MLKQPTDHCNEDDTPHLLDDDMGTNIKIIYITLWLSMASITQHFYPQMTSYVGGKWALMTFGFPQQPYISFANNICSIEANYLNNSSQLIFK